MEGLTFFKNLEDLDSESKYLVHKAKEATQLSYSPYSKFQVGAALLLDDLGGEDLLGGDPSPTGCHR